jgi:hypothetical protein
MRGKKIVVLSSTAALLISAWLPILTITGSAMLAGCSSDRSDTRQDARTSTRTEGRVEDRHD